jgi:hypothetical protein
VVLVCKECAEGYDVRIARSAASGHIRYVNPANTVEQVYYIIKFRAH